MSTFSLLLKGSSLRALESIVSIIVGVITLPLMMRYLGVDLYGVWVLIGSFTALLYIFDMGFASAVTRHIAESIAQKNSQRTNQIVSNAFLIYSCLALLIIACVSLVAVFYRPDLKGILTEKEFATILWLFGAALAIEFPVKAFSGIATGYLRYDLLSLYRMSFRIVSSVILVSLLMSGYKLVSIACLQAGMGVVSAFAYFLVARHLFKPLSVRREFISKNVLSEIYRYSFWAFLVDINQLLKKRIDIFFVGAYLSLGAVSLYYVAVRLVEYVSELLYKMLNLALPILTKHSANEDAAAFREDLLLFVRINTYFAVLAFIAWVVIGEVVIYYWMGSDFDYQTTYNIMLILLLGRLSGVLASGFTSALYARKEHKRLAKISFFETLLSAGLLALVSMKPDPALQWVAYAISVPLLIGRLGLIPWVTLTCTQVAAPHKFLWVAFRPLLLSIFAVGWWIAIQNHWASANLLTGLMVIVTIMACILWLWMDLLPRERNLLSRLTQGVKRKLRLSV